MRVAVMIIALCLTMLIGLQSCAARVGGALLGDEATAGAGAVGVLLAFVYVLGAALVLAFPRASALLFLVGGIVSIGASIGSRFADLGIWGGASILLGAMAFVGARELKHQTHPAPCPAGNTRDVGPDEVEHADPRAGEVGSDELDDAYAEYRPRRRFSAAQWLGVAAAVGVLALVMNAAW